MMQLGLSGIMSSLGTGRVQNHQAIKVENQFLKDNFIYSAYFIASVQDMCIQEYHVMDFLQQVREHCIPRDTLRGRC